MFDLDISKLAVIGAVALVVIGPEKMPRVARTLGTMIGKAQRYVSDVKAEVNRSMDMEDLKKMKETMDSTLSGVQQSVLNATTKLNEGVASLDMAGQAEDGYKPIIPYQWTPPLPSYQHPGKNWRIKRSATPQWYKSRQGVRSRALSGAARVARFRPPSGMDNH